MSRTEGGCDRRREVGNILSGFFVPLDVKIIYIMYGTREYENISSVRSFQVYLDFYLQCNMNVSRLIILALDNHEYFMKHKMVFSSNSNLDHDMVPILC